MAEALADQTAILSALSTVLSSVTNPSLVVTKGLPWSIQQSRSCFYWYTGRGPGILFPGFTLADRNTVEKFKIGVYWLPPDAQQTYSAMVDEAWAVDMQIQQALWGAFTLNGEVQSIGLEKSDAGLWTHISGNSYYALEMELALEFPSADITAR